MSDVSKGAQRVRAVERVFHMYGYRTMIASRSGQRRGERHDSLALDGDLIAIAPADSGRPHFIIEVGDSGRPHFIVEIGGKSKSVKQSIAEMTSAPLPPGFVPLVVRLVDSRTRKASGGWRWHLSSTEAFACLGDVLESLRAN
jgi:hypothetical protein